MTARRRTKAHRGRVALSGPVTVQTATAIREELLTALEGSPVLSVSLREVTEADLCLVQLLVAANRSAAARGGRIVVEEDELPPEAAKVARLAGLERHRGCPPPSCLWPGRSGRCSEDTPHG